MKRYGIIISYNQVSGTGIIQDGKLNKYPFAKKLKNFQSSQKNFVQFQLSFDERLGFIVSRLSLPQSETKKESFESSYNLLKNQIELSFQA